MALRSQGGTLAALAEKLKGNSGTVLTGVIDKSVGVSLTRVGVEKAGKSSLCGRCSIEIGSGGVVGQFSSRSSMPTLNRYEPRTDPWGAPAFTGLGSDLASPTFTLIVRSERKQASRAIISEDAPFLAKASSQCRCSRRLNALLKSIDVKMTADYCLFSTEETSNGKAPFTGGFGCPFKFWVLQIRKNRKCKTNMNSNYNFPCTTDLF